MFFTFVTFYNRLFAYFFDKIITHICKSRVSIQSPLCFHLNDTVLHQLQLILVQLQPAGDVLIAFDQLCRRKTCRDACIVRMILDQMRHCMNAAVHRSRTTEIIYLRCLLFACRLNDRMCQLGNTLIFRCGDRDDRDAEQLLPERFTSPDGPVPLTVVLLKTALAEETAALQAAQRENREALRKAGADCTRRTQLEAARKTKAAQRTALEAAAAAAEQAAAARTATAAALAQQLTDAKQSVPGDLDALRARQTELQAARGQAAALEKALTAQLVPNRSAAADYRRLADARQTLEARWQWVNALAATAGGTLSSKQKIRLEAYIQMHYLDRILVHANTRLMQMTAGQYELERVGAENQRSQSGLDLGVIDHYNGTRRSVKTLSGGESFKASLALALGLSDEVQRTAGGIRLDTLFLDEGFGSLDDESLEQAIRVLSSLTEGDRLVGIISHVAALKDRIDRQVLVKKARSGGSTVELVV